MNTITAQIENKLDQLLVVLDKDIENIHENVSRLNELRSLVIKRDDVSLTKLLGRIQTDTHKYKQNETRRQMLRKELADSLNCGIEQVTLTRFEAGLSGEKKAQLSHRKTMLRNLTSQLKKEHASTAMLLSDCARLNSALLKGIFDVIQPGTVTYGPGGATERSSTAFMNLQF